MVRRHVSTSPFTKGFNTEISDYVDTLEYSKDELNVVLFGDNSKGRRRGLDYIEGGKFLEPKEPSLKTNATSATEWTDVSNKNNQTDYVVIQDGRYVYFTEKGDKALLSIKKYYNKVSFSMLNVCYTPLWVEHTAKAGQVVTDVYFFKHFEGVIDDTNEKFYNLYRYDKANHEMVKSSVEASPLSSNSSPFLLSGGYWLVGSNYVTSGAIGQHASPLPIEAQDLVDDMLLNNYEAVGDGSYKNTTDDLEVFYSRYSPPQEGDMPMIVPVWSMINSPLFEDTLLTKRLNTAEPSTVAPSTTVTQYVPNDYTRYKRAGEYYTTSTDTSEKCIDLEDYKINDTVDVAKYQVRFTKAYGALFMCSEAIKPFYIDSFTKNAAQEVTSGPRVSLTMNPGVHRYGRNIITRDNKTQGTYIKLFVDSTEIFSYTMRHSYDAILELERQIIMSNPTEDYEGHMSLFNTAIPVSFPGYVAPDRYTYYVWKNHWLHPLESTIFKADGHWRIPFPGVTMLKELLEEEGAPFNKTTGAYADWDIEISSVHGLLPKADSFVAEGITFIAPASSIYISMPVTLSLNVIKNKKSLAVEEVVNTAFIPYYSIYNAQEGVQLRIRDYKGEEDNLSVYDRSAISLTDTDYAKKLHYNLLNAGWTGAKLDTPISTDEGYSAVYAGMNTLRQFKEATGFYPSKAMSVSYGKDTDNTFIPSRLLEIAWGNTAAPKGHIILDFFNPNKEQSAGLVNPQGESVNTGVSYANIFDNTPRTIDYVTDIHTAFGRIFYLTGDSILYSPVLAEDIKICGQCYQAADPTSESLSDTLSSDGGFIELPEIGVGIRVVSLGGALLIFGTKNNVYITGGSDTPFTATQYQRGVLPFFPTNSPDSFIKTEVGVFYLSTVGVCLVRPTETGQLTIDNISENTIQTYYNNITNTSKERAKGFYNTLSKEVVWLLPSEEEQEKYNSVLIYNLVKGGFSKYSFALTDEYGNETPYIVNALELDTPFKSYKFAPIYDKVDGDEISVVSEDGYAESISINNAIDAKVDTFERRLFLLRDPANGNKLIFADLTNMDNKDYAHGLFGVGLDYPSYIVSHPFGLAEDNGKYTTFRLPNLLTGFKRTEVADNIFPSSCKASALWDWNITDKGGKWDAPQEVYRPDRTYYLSDAFVQNRTRVMGRGKAVQVKLEADGAKDFVLYNLGFEV